MIWLAALTAMLCAALLAWRAYAWFRPALGRYRQVYTQETGIKLTEVFLFIDPAQLWLAAIVCCVFAGASTFVVTGSGVLALVVSALTSQVPKWLLNTLRQRRVFRFEQQLPAALQALAGALQAGVSVSTALRHIVEQASAPLAQEFGLMLREQRLGVSFDAALRNLKERTPSESSTLVVAALQVASQTGGNLAETLEGIANTLRARLQLQGKVKALTAQGKMQAWIVGSLPVALALALDQLEPESMSVLWHTPLGWGVLTVVIGLECAGIFMIRRIVNIDI